MSEKITTNIEHRESSSSEHSHEKSRTEAHVYSAEEARAEAQRLEKLEADARRQVAEQSVDTEKEKILERLKHESESSNELDIESRPASSELKQHALNKEMNHIRKKLNKTDRVGSKVIHQPIVRSVSEISSKTITRPSGLLGGGITAFLGTSLYLYLTKHIGLKYNYSMFLFLLIGGFVLGVLIEALVRLLRTRRTA